MIIEPYSQTQRAWPQTEQEPHNSGVSLQESMPVNAAKLTITGKTAEQQGTQI
jgi:hypothetical protein